MIFLTREAELIIKYRNNKMSEDEITELGLWLQKCEANLLLFLELTDDNYLRGECGTMMEGDQEADWKKLEKRLSDAEERPVKQRTQLSKKGVDQYRTQEKVELKLTRNS
jgi:hypothetical protein